MPKDIDDRFKKFGTVSFTQITKVNDFIKHLEEGKVEGTKCKKCGQYWAPEKQLAFIAKKLDISPELFECCPDCRD